VPSAEPEAIATGRGCKISSGENLQRHPWRGSGAIRIKRDAAPELLARLYGWFTEGLDALDLKEAKSSLNELSA
jgi:hypothetical protein